ncbi:hypothetical protein [Helcococcus ovis]|nr:hypothetical protein [Helcococcus ovis]TFF67380.1 hypothetical protein EQF93_05475 [Helcococcus ovis]WNZ01875.1 hypothetical protein EQF90_003295 [Helcococcus ovis]
MKYIKDFFYNFSDLIFALIIILGISFVLYFNFNNLVNIESKASNIIKEDNLKKEDNSEIEVTIPKGINYKQLSEILFEYKIIKDKDSFTKYLEKSKKNIIYGTHKIRKNLAFDQIKDIILAK